MSKSSHSGIDISDDIGPITNNFNYSYFLKGLKAQRLNGSKTYWFNGTTVKFFYPVDTFMPLRPCDFTP
jgi:hypothetical protein